MGSRLLDDDVEHDPDDPDAPAVLPRKPKPSALKKIASNVPTGSVGSSLDDFITKANEGLLDVKENPPSRERELEAKVNELERKLASAEQRVKSAQATRSAATEPVMPNAPQSRGWGGIVVAFVLGCAAMFAVSTFVLKKESQATASVGKRDVETATPAPSPTPTVEPIAPAPDPTPATAQVPAPEAAPVVVAAPATSPVKAAAKKQPKHASPSTDRPKATEAAHSGSDELYNPF